ncbi:MAG: hypothetical protein ACQXXJ_07580, partial [Candidatus Bathyarchaeia archaeon]
FLDLIDISMTGDSRGCLKSVPSNYGYVFFWYGWLNKRALQKHYQAYVPKEKIRDLRKNRRQDASLKLQDQISDLLFSIVRDHPDTIDGGHAEVHLAVLAPRLKQMGISDAATALKEYAQKLERIEKFTRKYLKKKSGNTVEEIETSFEVIDYITADEVKKFADEYFWDDECGYLELSHRKLGCEIQVRIHFDGDEKLSEVVERIDKIINPIKPEIEEMFRFGKSCWPF